MTAAWLELDRASMLVHVDAGRSVGEVERALAHERLTLGAVVLDEGSIAEWIARGAPGARRAWDDPADHLVAGYTATFGERRIVIRPAPRRATGPDLFALVTGHGERMARLEAAWLRVHHVDARIPTTAPFRGDDHAWTDAEERLTLAIAAELSARRPR